MREVFNIKDIISRLQSIEQAQKDIGRLMKLAIDGDAHAREKLVESLMPLAYFYGQSDAYMLANRSRLNVYTIRQNMDDITGEAMLALMEAVNFAIAYHKGEEGLIKKVKSNIHARIMQYIRKNIFKISKEVPVSSTGDPKGENSGNSFMENWSEQTDADVDFELVAQLMKESIVKTLSKYHDKDSVQLLYAYSGLHRSTFTELIEEMGINRKEAFKRIKAVMEWFRKETGVI